MGLDPRRRPFLGALAPAIAHAAMFAAMFAPAFVWQLAFVQALPLIWLGWRTRSGLRSGLAVSLIAAPAWWFHHAWIADVSALGLPFLVAYLCLWPGVFVWTLSAVSRRLPAVPLWVVAPTIWVALETLRGEVVWNGYAWYLAAHPTIDWPGFAAFASIGGVYLVSLLVVAPGALLVDVLRWWKRAGEDRAGPWGGWTVAGLVGVIGVAAVAGAGAIARPAETEPGSGTLRVAIVETHLPQSNKIGWSLDDRLRRLERWVSLTAQAASASPRPDVVVWPETMFPGETLEPDAVAVQRASGLGYPDVAIGLGEMAEGLARFQGAMGVPMIVGAIALENLRYEEQDGRIAAETDATFNSAFVLRDGVVDPRRYDKIHLTPFGEVMPYISAVPALEQRLLDLGAQGMSFGLTAGGAPVRLEIPAGPDAAPWRPRELADGALGSTVVVATPICFEVTSSAVCRRLVFEDGERAADVIIQLTNDGWFGAAGAGKENHLALARWRCVELATPLARASNTGISAVVNARGEILTRTEPTPGAPDPSADGRLVEVAVRLAPPAATTTYARIGNAVGWGSVLALAALLVIGGVAGTEEPAPEASPDAPPPPAPAGRAGARGPAVAAPSSTKRRAKGDRRPGSERLGHRVGELRRRSRRGGGGASDGPGGSESEDGA